MLVTCRRAHTRLVDASINSALRTQWNIQGFLVARKPPPFDFFKFNVGYSTLSSALLNEINVGMFARERLNTLNIGLILDHSSIN